MATSSPRGLQGGHHPAGVRGQPVYGTRSHTGARMSSTRALKWLSLIVVLLLLLQLKIPGLTKITATQPRSSTEPRTQLRARHSTEPRTQPRARHSVAFVIVGSGRTLHLQLVHEFIEHNVVRAFCPPDSCDAEVFLRFSLTDNVPDGRNAKGKWMESLEDSFYDTSSGRRIRIGGREVHADRVDIGSEEERRQMDAFLAALEPVDLRHRHAAFRSDVRRYSMFFNRAMAFERVRAFETEQARFFDFVFMLRTDMHWATPVPPVTWFDRHAPNETFVHEVYFCDVPDTFAILPRGKAESYFSINERVAPGVMCLGGPGLDEQEVRENKEFSAAVARLAPEDWCSFHPGNHGWSEQILSRHLNHANIVARPLPASAIIIRRPLRFVCNPLAPRYHTLDNHAPPNMGPYLACLWNNDIALHNAEPGAQQDSKLPFQNDSRPLQLRVRLPVSPPKSAGLGPQGETLVLCLTSDRDQLIVLAPCREYAPFRGPEREQAAGRYDTKQLFMIDVGATTAGGHKNAGGTGEGLLRQHHVDAEQAMRDNLPSWHHPGWLTVCSTGFSGSAASVFLSLGPCTGAAQKSEAQKSEAVRVFPIVSAPAPAADGTTDIGRDDSKEFALCVEGAVPGSSRRCLCVAATARAPRVESREFQSADAAFSWATIAIPDGSLAQSEVPDACRFLSVKTSNTPDLGWLKDTAKSARFANHNGEWDHGIRCGEPNSSGQRLCSLNDTICGEWKPRWGSGKEEKKWWRPSTCFFEDVSSADARRCVGNRTLAFIGDSMIRDVGYAVAMLLSGYDDIDAAPLDKLDKNSDEYLRNGTQIPDFSRWGEHNVPAHNFNGYVFPKQGGTPRARGGEGEGGSDPDRWQVQLWNLYAEAYQRNGQPEDVLSNRLAGQHPGRDGNPIEIRPIDLAFINTGLHDQGYWWDPPFEFGAKFFDSAWINRWRTTLRQPGMAPSVWVSMNPQVASKIESTEFTFTPGAADMAALAKLEESSGLPDSKQDNVSVSDAAVWQARMVEEANLFLHREMPKANLPYWDAAALLRSKRPRHELSADGVHLTMQADRIRAKMLMNHLCDHNMRWRGTLDSFLN